MKKLYKPLTESMVTHGWQRIILLLILTFFSQAAISQTIDFEDQTYTGQQNLGTNVLTIGNFKFTVAGGWSGNGSKGSNFSKSIEPYVSAVDQRLEIETVDGSEFHFESFWNAPGPLLNRYSSIKGFKNGIITGESAINATSGTISMPDYLDDIDKVIITGDVFLWGVFDDFVFSAPSTSANIAPIITAPTAPTVTEGATDVALADDIHLTEADLEDSHILTFSIKGGTLSLGANGITFGGNGNNSASFTAQGSVAGLNAALDAATFTPSPNVSGIGAGEISFVANDGKTDSNTASIAFNIENVNDDPSFSSTAVTELNGDQTYEYEITITDLDSDELTLTATTQPDWLTFDNTGAGTVTTLAGSGTRASIDGTGTEASFYDPSFLTVDGNQNVYVVEGHRIRKITPEGVVTTFAGDVSSGNQDGIGTAARFRYINDLAVDKDGNIYVADNQNVSIRKITPEGVVSTFVTNMSNGQTTFSNPTSLSINDSGNIYLRDQTGELWKITPSGEVSAISNPKTYGGPYAIAVDQAGNIYQAVNRTQVIILTNKGNEVFLAGAAEFGNVDGTGASARFNGISAIYVDDAGIVYLSDSGNNKIRKITPQGVVTTLAGTGTAGEDNGFGTAASFLSPAGLGVDNQGYFYVADDGNKLIRKIAPSSYALTGSAATEVGTHDVVLTLNDGNGGSATQSFSIFVSDVVEFDGTASNRNESESTAIVPVSLSKALATEASVNYAISGTAQSGVDHTFTAGTLTFSAGETTKNITISGIVDDTEIEANETIILTLSNAVGIDLGNQNVHTYTINDNDVSAANAGADAATCNSNLNLAGNAPDATSGETGAWSIISGENGTIRDAADPNTLFDGRGGNTYTLRWTLSKGGATSTDDVQITMNVNPLASAGPDKQIRGAGNLQGNMYAGVTGMWTIEGGDGKGVLGDPTSPTSTFSGTHRVLYTLRWTLSNDFCSSNFDDVDIEYFNNELPEFTTTPGISVNDNDSYRYFVNILDKDDAPAVTATTKPDWLTISTLPAETLSTVAGAQTSGDNNGFATEARFKFPNDVAMDAEGNIYVADQSNSLIRKIAPGGQVSTFAGSGNQASNDGTGTAASFNGPARIAVDASGNVYVADTFNNLIRKITKDGVVTTIASGISQPYGIAVDAQGIVYVASIQGNTIHKVSTSGQVTTLAGSGSYGTKNGTGAQAEFSGPTGLALDAAGNVYVADWGSHLIRKITPAGVVTTWAGSGTQASTDSFGTFASFNSPKGITVDTEGIIYVTENTGGRIRKILADRTVLTLRGTQPTATNILSNPEGLTIDKAGNLIIADYGNNMIKLLPAKLQYVLSGSASGQKGIHNVVLKNDDGHGGVVEQSFSITVNDATAPVFTSATTASFAENGTGTAYTVTATDANALTFSLGTGNDEALFDIAAGVVTFKASPDFESPADANTDNAYVINVIASDGSNAVNQDVTITVTNVNEAPSFTSSPVTTVNDNTSYSYTIEVNDPENDALTVAATNKPDWLSFTNGVGVSTFAGSGTAGTVDGTGTAASFNQPVSLAIDAADNLYVGGNGSIIRKITPEGVVSTFAGSGIQGISDGIGTAASFILPAGMAIDDAGNLFVADNTAQTIRKITPAGVVTTFGGTANEAGSLDGTGANARFNGPSGLAIDAANNLYVCEFNSGLIRKITPQGVVTTIAGSTTNRSGDGTGTAAGFNGPIAMTIDDSGNLYVTEQRGHVIRKITPGYVVTTIAGQATPGSNDGTGTVASFNTPFGVAINDDGNLYVSDGGNNTIRKITPAGVVTTIAGLAGAPGNSDGIGGNARFTTPTNLVFNSSGELLVAGFRSNLIRKIKLDAVLSGNAIGQTGAHNVTLTVSDDFGGTSQQNFTINVNDVTDPVFTSGTTASFAENGTGTVYTVAATDVNTVTYSLGTGNDEALFDITAGVVTFKSSPDFENPADANTDNAYVINVIASDGINSANQDVTITVTNVDEAPEFLSDAVTSVDDNKDYSYNIRVSDQEDDNLTVTATIKPDWLNLTLDEPLSVSTIAGSGETDGQGTGVSKDGIGTDAAFGFPRSIVTDASGNIYMADLVAGAIRKIDQNAVVTTIAGNTTYEHKDGSGTSASFNGLNDIALGPQGNLYITSGSSIRKMTPEGVVSTLAGSSDGSTGYMDGTGSEALFSAVSGITYDAVTNALYVTDIRNARIRKVTLDGVVTTFAGNGTVGNDDGTASVASFNSPQDIVVDSKGNFYVADAQSRRVRKITASGMVSTFAGSSSGFKDGKGTAAQFDYFTAMTIDNEDILYVADAENNRIRRISPEGVVSTLLGGEQGYIDGDINVARLTRPQYLAVDTDQNLILFGGELRLRRVNIDRGNQLKGSPVGQKGTFNVTLSLTDGTNDPLTQSFTVTVNDATKPVFTSTETAAFAENGSGTVYTALATDTNPVTYSLSTGNDESLFNIDGTSGAVTFKASPDFETPVDANSDNAYVIYVIASDGVNTVNQDVTITVTNVDDTNPVFTSATAVDFAENGTGTAYTVVATDASAVTYSLGSGNDEALFNIAAGEVTFKTSPDFENPADANSDNAYVINVIASDGINSVNQDVTITVTNVDDTDPVFTSATAVDFAENTTGTAYTVVATDANALTYSLGSGNDEALFDMTAGEVTFKTAPDFENPADANSDNAYIINVIASDGINSVNQDVTITVTNVDDMDPVFTSGTAVGFEENGTGTAYTIAATDANALTYSLGSGNDGALFDVDGTSGIVTFKTSPDFENPTDTNTDNAYVINVIASDGINSVNQDVTITVTNVDDTDPVFTSATAVDFAENGTGTAYTVVATDANTVTYSLGTGNDETLFTIDGSSGAVAFKTAPDFENPVDANTDNAYVITVIASDGINAVNQDVVITVTDVDEIAPSLSITSTASSATRGMFTVTFEYNEVVTGFELGDIIVTNGTAGNFTSLIAGRTWTAEITPTSDGIVRVNAPAAIAIDGTGNANTPATEFSILNDETAPTVVLSAATPTNGSYAITATFNEDVFGFVAGDVSVSNGTLSNFNSTDAKTYTFNISSSNTQAMVSVGTDVATDAVGNTNTASNELNLVFNNQPTDLTLSTTSISENNAIGDVIGTFSTTDADAEDTHSYTLVTGTGAVDNDAFTIDGSQLKANIVFDFELKSSYSIRVKTTDSKGGDLERVVAISIDNVLEGAIILSGNLDFDISPLGISQRRTLTVSNVGEKDVEVRVISVPTDFVVTPGAGIVNVSGELTIEVAFTPTAAVEYAGQIVLEYEGGTVAINASGEGAIITAIDDGVLDGEDISLYPNPTSGMVNIDLNNDSGRPLDISLIDGQGKALFFKMNHVGNSLRLDVSEYKSGIYLMQFTDGLTVVRKKVIVKK